MLFGYAYPAFQCFKAVEKNKMDTEQLRFWCQYCCAFSLVLQGTTYVYESFFRPYLAKHETEIDRSIVELRARFTDITLLYVQKATSFGQTRAMEIMQYVATHVATQTMMKPKPTQEQIGAITKQSSTLAENLQAVPTAEDKPHRQATLEEVLPEKLKQSPPLRTKSSPAQMTVLPKFTEEIITSQSKDARVRLRIFRSSVYH
ncbi:hypothetical protein MKW94_015545 [Papaver nudicaule]|uniref:HVA22-like protein n=1 Tax=Papaver nudicaule TaxID=74823 RepID=A0AA41S6N8_PAPNU|nr:hypothetical protein [Papaver nudicaule]MCL7038660.1 hypothetical protein [Papaver nudicaule]